MCLIHLTGLLMTVISVFTLAVHNIVFLFELTDINVECHNIRG